MKTICRLSLCLIAFTALINGAIETSAAQPESREPIVSLRINNLPLGEALATLSRDTGYRFHLDSQWKTYPVSVNASHIPLEKVLKRLLRNLNHSIIWESENAIRIMVYGESEAADSTHAVSFAAPPQEEVPEEMEPFDTEDSLGEESFEEPVEEGDQTNAIEAPSDMVPDEQTGEPVEDAQGPGEEAGGDQQEEGSQAEE
jgi:hypothetical protein